MPKTRTPLFSALPARILAAVFGVLFASITLVAGMPTYLPFMRTDAIGVPILFFPLIWAGLFLYCFLARTALRPWLLLLGLVLVHGAVIYFHFTGG